MCAPVGAEQAALAVAEMGCSGDSEMQSGLLSCRGGLSYKDIGHCDDYYRWDLVCEG